MYKYLIGVLVLLAIGGALFFYKVPQMAGAYSVHTERTYHNSKFNFTVEMPSSWTRYAVLEKQEENKYVIWFGLRLQGTTTARYLGGPEETSRVINIDRLEIMPAAYFDAHKNDCNDPSIDGPCFFPDEITRDTNYVYASGVPRPHAGWDYCKDAAGTESYVCGVYKDSYLPQEGKTVFEKTLTLLK
ncbi:MAG: hypothetical protein JWL87_193 [Candidatus Adlerbacteria bacterium]|nr:hypothetical protein [Candidatus Adlerbacteria bacterium]